MEVAAVVSHQRQRFLSETRRTKLDGQRRARGPGQVVAPEQGAHGGAGPGEAAGEDPAGGGRRPAGDDLEFFFFFFFVRFFSTSTSKLEKKKTKSTTTTTHRSHDGHRPVTQRRDRTRRRDPPASSSSPSAAARAPREQQPVRGRGGERAPRRGSADRAQRAEPAVPPQLPQGLRGVAGEQGRARPEQVGQRRRGGKRRRRRGGRRRRGVAADDDRGKARRDDQQPPRGQHGARDGGAAGGVGVVERRDEGRERRGRARFIVVFFVLAFAVCVTSSSSSHFLLLRRGRQRLPHDGEHHLPALHRQDPGGDEGRGSVPAGAAGRRVREAERRARRHLPGEDPVYYRGRRARRSVVSRAPALLSGPGKAGPLGPRKERGLGAACKCLFCFWGFEKKEREREKGRRKSELFCFVFRRLCSALSLSNSPSSHLRAGPASSPASEETRSRFHCCCFQCQLRRARPVLPREAKPPGSRRRRRRRRRRRPGLSMREAPGPAAGPAAAGGLQRSLPGPGPPEG